MSQTDKTGIWIRSSLSDLCFKWQLWQKAFTPQHYTSKYLNNIPLASWNIVPLKTFFFPEMALYQLFSSPIEARCAEILLDVWWPFLILSCLQQQNLKYYGRYKILQQIGEVKGEKQSKNKEKQKFHQLQLG